MGAPYIYDISRLRVKDLHSATYIYVVRRLRVNKLFSSPYMFRLKHHHIYGHLINYIKYKKPHTM